jgi:predicted lipoprotein with Yx(FWY)xxD motif
MEIKKLTVMLALVGAAVITMVSCKKNDYNNVPPPPPPPPPPVEQGIVLQNSATLGSYLTDKQNHTLYFFANDANGQDSCTGGCQALWMAYTNDNLTQDKVGNGLDFSDFGSITSATGKKQITYKGWPLYLYTPGSQQEAPGLTSGEGLLKLWFVAKPDYTIMFANEQLTGLDGKQYKSDYTEGTGKTIYFTDGRGRTIYTFSHDSADINKFTKADFSNDALWPIYDTSKIVVPSILQKTDFTTFQVFGRNQLAYRGWPLHYFGQDGTTRGANKGVSVLVPGTWPVLFQDKVAAP